MQTQSRSLLFIFLLWLPWLGLPKLLKNSGESGYLYLVLDLRAFSFSPLTIMFAIGLLYMAFIMLRYDPSMLSFWRDFYHKWVKNLFCIYWDYHYLSFNVLIVNIVYHTDWLYREEPLHPLDEPDFIMVYDYFNVLLILFARVLLRIRASISISDIGHNLLFGWCLCLALVWGWLWPHITYLKIFFPVQFFGRVWEG